MNDGVNFHPTNRVVLVRSSPVAAIAGAGPFVGPVLAAQFGFSPGFWLVIGAVLAGAVQDFIIPWSPRCGATAARYRKSRMMNWPINRCTATAVAVLLLTGGCAGGARVSRS